VDHGKGLLFQFLPHLWHTYIKQACIQKMNQQKIKSIFFISALVLLSNLVLPELLFGQNVGVSISINHLGPLSISYYSPAIQLIPNGNGTLYPGTHDQNIFSTADPTGVDSVKSRITVSDLRASGGFTLSAQADNFVLSTTPAITISADNLRVVTATQPQTQDGLGYGHGPGLITPPSMNIISPIYPSNYDSTAQATLWSESSPYDIVENHPVQNKLGQPVIIMNSCIAQGQPGYVGTITDYLAFQMKIPAFTPPGLYFSKITYTLADNTPVTCP